MHLVCPHCRHPIEVVSPPPEEVVCPSCGSSVRVAAAGSTASADTAAGRRVGRFTLLRAVGQGAFGTVYQARDDTLDRVVALKLPRAGNLPDSGPDEGDLALLESHVKEFDITGRAMKGWVLVGPQGVEGDEQLGGWVERATKFVKTLPTK
jgi:hypothetical protein